MLATSTGGGHLTNRAENEVRHSVFIFFPSFASVFTYADRCWTAFSQECGNIDFPLVWTRTCQRPAITAGLMDASQRAAVDGGCYGRNFSMSCQKSEKSEELLSD